MGGEKDGDVAVCREINLEINVSVKRLIEWKRMTVMLPFAEE